MQNLTLCIIKKDDKILLGKKKRRFGAGRWNGYGGKLLPSEELKESLIREIKEELNIDIEIISPLQESVYEYPGLAVTLIPFIAKWIGGDLVIKEHESVQWLSKDQLFLPDWAAADLPVVRALDNSSVW